ncbi:MAG: DUF427 domain-containing protein [Rhodospirillaceae bacterium]|nr:DUF427 domain-containing protein [Rhodospirillaceae bacterium]
MRKPHLMSLGPHIPPLERVVQYAQAPGYVVFTMPVEKRIRVEAAGVTVADSRRALILWESEHLPVYYFPLRDIRMDLMMRTDHASVCPYKGTAEYYSLNAGGRTVENLLWRYATPIPECPPIGDYAAFYWTKADRWLEEDEEVFVHPRDPYKRIDCLPSSARIEVSLDGVRLADSSRAVMLFETGLPTRYYLPVEDVTPGILSPSDHSTRCPYKGKAGYHHVTVNGKRRDNIVWFYADPVPEAGRIRGRVCFYNEFVDITLDGKTLERPKTAFS